MELDDFELIRRERESSSGICVNVGSGEIICGSFEYMQTLFPFVTTHFFSEVYN